MTSPTPLSEFDGYELLEPIGEGGMGQVYRGRDTLLDRPVAIKFISAGLDANPEVRRRFLVEARAVARLHHPSVVAVYRAGEVDGRPYIVSEFVDGCSLDQLPVPVPYKQLLRIADDLSRGLSVAHAAGIVHRDIKPGNAILDTDGQCKLLDFGIARLLDAGAELREPTPAPYPVPQRATANLDATRPVVLPDRLPESEPDATVAVSLPPRLQGTRQGDRATRAGGAIGTPGYMAPEIWQGNNATAASDVYSLGALLFTLCIGRPPHWTESLGELRERVLTLSAPNLIESGIAVPPAFAAVVARCLHRDPNQRYLDGDQVRAALAPLTAPSGASLLPEGNPYRGLRPFESEHQAFFFGRDAEVRAVLDRLRTDPVVIVTGDSGVGKSSLCRAGVLSRAPAFLDESLEWKSVTVIPGVHPLSALCHALGNVSGASPDELEQALDAGISDFGRVLRKALVPHGHGIVLFLDQLEEILTLSVAREANLVAALLAWGEPPVPGFRIVATVRGDFLSRLATLPSLSNSLSRYLYFLRPLTAQRIREAVLGPALATGLRFEDDATVDILVDATVDAGGGGLPLLQFALQMLWERRDTERAVIPAGALAELGGVAGALSVHADDVLAQLGSARRPHARHVMEQLVTTDGTRARRSRVELLAAQQEAAETLDALVRGRLLVVQESPDGPLYEIAHEALLNGWDTLRDWLDQNVASRAAHGRLRAARDEWERLGRPVEALFNDRQLREARVIDKQVLTPEQSHFLRLSRRVVNRRRILRRGAVLLALIAVVGTYGGMKVKTALEHAREVADRIHAGQVVAQRAAALKLELDEVTSAAYAAFDRQEKEEGEATWDRAQKMRSRYRASLAEASRDFEAAIAIDASDEEARNGFAAILFARAQEAEARRNDDEMDELLQRMALYDPGGEWRSRWDQPASVTVVTDLAPDEVQLLRYEPGDHQRLLPATVSLPGDALGRSVALQPGSYRIDFKLAGRVIQLPFLLARGESRQLDVELAPADSTPAGFIYVPRGDFLFGSAQSDGLRKGFHHTVPLHRVNTGPFYVARHETTFADWLAYVDDAAAPQDREKRLPMVHAGGFEGALTLTRENDRWRLTFKPTATRFSALAGEQVVYPGRDRRKEQDWLRFPVAGITAAEAAEYAAWLASSGRVPGARLCTDREWEFAARGADGREYPHGHFMGPDDANFDATYAKDPKAMGPDEVGSHPVSRSPFGLDDVSGNVWEWTRSSVEPDGHAARGGSYYFDINSARTSNREVPEPSFRDTSVGFRVCADIRNQQ